MKTKNLLRLRSLASAALLVGTLGAATIAAPLSGMAQSADGAVVYAATDLNLRKGPGNTDAIYMTVPAGAELHLASGEATDEYIPVSYNGSHGWVLNIGVALPVGAGESPEVVPGSGDSLSLYQQDARVTLSPLMLRLAPDIESEAIAGMPEGSLVTLTNEGYENGYILVDYGGARGWAYADLLAEPNEVS